MSITPECRRVASAFWARRASYGITAMAHHSGRCYRVCVNGYDYKALLVEHSYSYYELRYHLAEQQPDVCLCEVHDSVLPIPCIHLDSSNLAESFAIPEKLVPLQKHRSSQSGTRALVSLCVLGVHEWVDFVESLPDSTRKRYMARARAMSKRPAKGGRPVSV